MLRSTARISTPRAVRYRDQLAKHGAGMLRQRHGSGSDNGPPIRDATTTDQTVVLDLAWGRCTVIAADNALVLVAEADTEDNLAKIQAGVGQRVTRIGRRDRLAVTWSPAEGEPPAGRATVAAPRRRSRILVGVTLVGAVLVIGGTHLGIGAALLRSNWTWWGLAALGALVVLKLYLARHLASSMLQHRSIGFRGHRRADLD